MVRILHFSAFVLLCISFSRSHAQDKCGTPEYEQIRDNSGVTKDAFEQWMSHKLQEERLTTFGVQANQYTIPVVVHVIHNGTTNETNISDLQIQSQIDVINADYKRLNADAVNTPAEFLPVAGSIDIQFVLAKQDPEGLATTGITRTLGTKTEWSMADNNDFKALSYWPAENYLNIWVVNLASPLLGYAQLPVSNLQGLENSSNDRLTDGVVVDYKVFGSGAGFNLDTQYNKGRTTTHEVGHFLGLRHIWGDASCGTDYVDDTPFQTTSTNFCPTGTQPSCEAASANKPHKMYQNYMDYTNDACMNLFTQKQVDRFTIVLQNSPRRNSLLSSPGATDPVPAANDLGIRQIISPTSTSCLGSVAPQIEVRNYGSNTITSAQIQFQLNGNTIETKTFSGLSLAPSQTATFSFTTSSLPASSTQTFAFQILQTNGGADGKPDNNSKTVQVNVPASTSLPLIEPFNSTPASWQIVNQDGSITWANITAPDNNASNKAMYMNFNSYQNEGSLDWLITPSFAITTPLTSQLKFDLSYAMFPGETSDELKVYALPGCNNDLSQAILLYDKSGTELSTTSNTSNSYVPTSESQWRKSEVVSLSPLNAVGTWQLAFIGKNGYGNNLYVDNVTIADNVVNDVAITGIVSPSLVHCKSNVAVQVSVKNFSTLPVTTFQIQSTLNNGSVVTQTFNATPLAIGEQRTFTLNAVNLLTGKNVISLTAVNPNGFSDASPSNNTFSFNTYFDQSTDSAPLRVTFDNPAEVPWISAIPLNASSWVSVSTDKNQSISYKAYDNSTIGEESWFASPVLDMTLYEKNSLLFDLSYAQNVPANDRLRVVASTDCGLTYPLVLFDQVGSQFSVKNSSLSWRPTASTDWRRQYVSLDTVSGKKSIRLAFITTNAHGNNIFLDNIEIFAGDDPQPAMTSVPYQIYYSTRNLLANLAITFHLDKKQDVRLQIFSVMGQLVLDNILPETLNQTYYFDLSAQANGIYIFRVQTSDQLSATKVFVSH